MSEKSKPSTGAQAELSKISETSSRALMGSNLSGPCGAGSGAHWPGRPPTGPVTPPTTPPTVPVPVEPPVPPPVAPPVTAPPAPRPHARHSGLPPRLLQQWPQPRQRRREAGVQVHLVQLRDGHPRHALALAVQPQVAGLDPPRGDGQHGRVRPATVVVDRPRAEDHVVREQPELLAHLPQRAVVGRFAVVQRTSRRPPGAAVVRPGGAVLEEHLGTAGAVAVQEDAGGPGPAPVAVALGAGRPAVGRGEHPPSEPGPRKRGWQGGQSTTVPDTGRAGRPRGCPRTRGR